MNHQELPGQIGFDGITQEDRVYQNAVERVRLAHEVAKGEKLYVAFSGGKDSTVLWGIVCDAARADGIPVEQYAQRHYNITGMDPPELIYHMRENCPDLHRRFSGQIHEEDNHERAGGLPGRAEGRRGKEPA